MVNYKFKNPYKEEIKIGKIVCLAQTYKKHAKEMNSHVTKNPIIFLKPTSSVIFNNDSIIIPPESNCIHHEVELGVVIDKRCKKINYKNANDYILGYCLALDITARDIQKEAKKKGWPWTIAKGFDTFAPLSDVILKNEIDDPNCIDILLKLNGELKQKSNTKNMIHSIEKIIEYISNIMTLEKGDLILTGTPEGVGEIIDGDVIEAKLNKKLSLKIKVEK
jgi:2-keto-4-pentenoate hydratase/2-oxohepta-3-ene-1,7-dioic acid hydratase in catechol pathway